MIRRDQGRLHPEREGEWLTVVSHAFGDGEKLHAIAQAAGVVDVHPL